jgi:hypothetical protein
MLLPETPPKLALLLLLLLPLLPPLLLMQDELKAASKQLAEAKAQLAVAKAAVSGRCHSSSNRSSSTGEYTLPAERLLMCVLAFLWVPRFVPRPPHAEVVFDFGALLCLHFSPACSGFTVVHPCTAAAAAGAGVAGRAWPWWCGPRAC